MSNKDSNQQNNEFDPYKQASDPEYVVVEPHSRQGNVALAAIAGLVSCVLVATVWAFICIVAEKQWVWMGIVAGFVVGWCVRVVSGGNNATIGFFGAFFALLSCLMGDFFTNLGFLAQEEGVEFLDALMLFDYKYLFDLLFVDFDFFSGVVYFIAIIEGFSIGMGKSGDEKE